MNVVVKTSRALKTEDFYYTGRFAGSLPEGKCRDVSGGNGKLYECKPMYVDGTKVWWPGGLAAPTMLGYLFVGIDTHGKVMVSADTFTRPLYMTRIENAWHSANIGVLALTLLGAKQIFYYFGGYVRTIVPKITVEVNEKKIAFQSYDGLLPLSWYVTVKTTYYVVPSYAELRYAAKAAERVWRKCDESCYVPTKIIYRPAPNADAFEIVNKTRRAETRITLLFVEGAVRMSFHNGGFEVLHEDYAKAAVEMEPPEFYDLLAKSETLDDLVKLARTFVFS